MTLRARVELTCPLPGLPPKLASFHFGSLQEVEPMATECDHIQITALSQALSIALQVEYVDEMDTALNHHVFPEAATPSVYLLYKTSHYNILYAADKH